MGIAFCQRDFELVVPPVRLESFHPSITPWVAGLSTQCNHVRVSCMPPRLESFDSSSIALMSQRICEYVS
jgi:hypothetical protein